MPLALAGYLTVKAAAIAPARALLMSIGITWAVVCWSPSAAADHEVKNCIPSKQNVIRLKALISVRIFIPIF